MAAAPIIYGLVDPVEPSRVRYVGQTTKPPVVRYLGHVGEREHSKGRKRVEWIAALRQSGRLPDMVLLERVADGESIDDRELSWIADLQRRGLADLNAPAPKWFVAGDARPASPWWAGRRAPRDCPRVPATARGCRV